MLDKRLPIVLYVDTPERGGTTAYTADLALGLARRQHAVSVICHKTPVLEPIRQRLQAAGVRVYPIENSERSWRGRVGRIARMLSVLRQHRRGVLVGLLGYFTWGGPMLIAGRLAGMRAIVRADLQSPMPPIRVRQRIGIRLKDLLADRVVVGSIENRELFVSQTGRRASKFAVVHTGIHLDRYVPGQGRDATRADLGIAADALVVTMIARIDADWWRKGIPEFLAMTPAVAAGCPRAVFLLVGEGVNRPQAEDRARELGVHDRFVFTGWRSDVPNLLAATDVFVMPSLFEGGPMIVLEAMAMAKPVVATSVGMVPEVMENGVTGFVVPPADSAALAERVLALLDAPDLRERLGQAARAEAERSLSLERMIDGYLDACARALDVGRRH